MTAVAEKREARTLEGIMSVPDSLRLTEEELQVRLAMIESMRGSELRREYRRVWGVECYSNNYAMLRKRITWRLSTFCYGSIGRAALEKARKLADASQMRERAPQLEPRSKFPRKPATKAAAQPAADVPPAAPAILTTATPTEWMSVVGHVLVKVHRGVRYEVHALPQGRCHCNGITFASLSAAAVSIAGYKCSGNSFFQNATMTDRI